MKDYGLRPEPARWALKAGLPAPRDDEGFIEYVTRLGLNAAELLVELTEQTMVLANARLNTQLQRRMRNAFDDHVEWLCCMHLDEHRREEIRRSAEYLFPGRCRPRPIV